MPEATIVADGLEKHYGDVSALTGVSTSVSAGEVFGLVGPNGAGKTTLVRCLTGTTTPSSGQVTLLGNPPNETDRNRIGLLPQDFSPPDRLTAKELITYYGGLYDDPRPVPVVLDDVGLTSVAETRYVNLSGGERRRTLVGAALVNDPDVLFLDEPTTGIDPAGRRAVWALIGDLADAGTTVFLTSHSMAEVERLADRVGVLVDGRLTAVGTPGELLAAHGGESRLVVTADPGATRPDELAGYPVEASARGLRIDGIDPAAIGAVVDALADAGVDYEALTWRSPDLETVYLELTGEKGTAPTGRPPAGVGGDAP